MNSNFLRIVLGLACGGLLAASAAWGQTSGALVTALTKEGAPGVVRLVFDVSAPTAPQVSVSGQRVDLTLGGAALGANVRNPVEDADLIRVLFISRRGDLVASALFRRPPQRAEASYDRARKQVVLQVFWDEAQGAGRVAILPRAAGTVRAQADGLSSLRTRRSAYADDWRRFFAEYETPLRFELLPRFSLPSLEPVSAVAPQAGDETSRRLEAALGAGLRGDWAKALTELGPLLPLPLEGAPRETLQVLYGEALLRSGATAAGRDQLRDFVERHPGGKLEARARYLCAYAQAVTGDPYGAAFQLSQARLVLTPGDALSPNLDLLDGEIQLSLGRDAQTLRLLDELSLPGAMDDLRQLARAGALVGLGRHAEALVLFDELEGRYGELRDAFAVERLARALYAERRYAEAAAAYGRLAQLSGGGSEEGPAWFAQAQALLRAGETREARVVLDRVLVAFPDSRGGPRATLKMTDLSVLGGDAKALVWAAMDYARMAEIAPERALREEAAFKQALVLHLQQDSPRAVAVLEQFVRQYFSGKLRGDAEALLADLLPLVIHELIEAGEHLEALVMVERHRELLLDQRISWEFLERLAGAFRDMELLGRAARVYLFMLDNNREPQRAQGLYLPLVRLLFLRDQFEMAVSYAERYAKEFPQGRDRAEVLLVRARALHAAGRSAEAADLLLAKNRPEGRDLDLWGGKICFELERYAEAAGCLSRLTQRPGEPPAPEELLLLAEALFRSERLKEALGYFEQLRLSADTADQAAYRSAQIYLRQGERERGLKLLRQLADEGGNDQWRRLGREKLEMLTL
ncbi:tetratricopeptide repeat protein [Geoalkalibacter sp.]|uniref:tetratricopeptide repeat protein n=1 Tax=Geoalkalibacter sp. TaxID=3041440 RepID=UPI00272ED6D7|nr:tetratricopeptide repeat protein [Geoalkalibacter sp.]